MLSNRTRISNNGPEFDDLLFKAHRGDRNTQYRLAVKYAKGRGVPPDMASAIQWYRESARSGHRDARYALYVLCESDNPPLSKIDSEAPSWYEVAVECGRPGSALALAQIYEELYKTSKNPADEQNAVLYYVKAAESGNHDAHIALFRLAQANFGGISQRDSRFTTWRLIAADRGDTNAQYSLAMMYEQAKNLPDAITWYERAATQDHTLALGCLDRLASTGNIQAKEAVIRVNAPKKLAQLQLDYQLLSRVETGDERARKAIAKTRGVKEDTAAQTAYFSLQGATEAYKPLIADDLISAQNQPKSVVLGNGKFGDVYAIRTASGKVFAMKVIPPGHDDIAKELQALKRVQSTWIIGFYGSFENKNKLHLLLELAVCALDKIIKIIPPHYALQLLLEMIQGLEVLHANGIIHCDLKPHNLLIGSDLHLRVADFSVSKTDKTVGHTTHGTESASTGGIVGTIQYISPEALEGKYTALGDMYAVGLIAWTLAAQSLLYTNKKPPEIVNIKNAGNRRGETTEKQLLLSTLPKNLLPAFSTAIARSCDKNPDKRWTAQTAHVYLKKEAAKTPVSDADIAQVVNAVKTTMPEPQRVFHPGFF